VNKSTLQAALLFLLNMHQFFITASTTNHGHSSSVEAKSLQNFVRGALKGCELLHDTRCAPTAYSVCVVVGGSLPTDLDEWSQQFYPARPDFFTLSTAFHSFSFAFAVRPILPRYPLLPRHPLLPLP